MATNALAVGNVQPTYDNTRGRFVKRAAITLKTSAAETATYTDDDGIYVDALTLSLRLNVTAVDTPTSLDVVIQGSNDGINWSQLGAFTQFTTGPTGDRYLECAGARYVRYVSTIVGTSYTYSITGTYRFG